MYLKSIEIQGFKSFAKKIVFDFPDGITGIVGPNGSGKSNVADAVRWVLGEQKIKQLRGSRMEDVIFAGTANRKPLGFAFVSITLDNSDHKLKLQFDEVTISRRVFRSGESEYMINGSICRLRDVQELLYDTGIGKEGYSIIGQGQIDKILQGKPEERRELFDEAVGIVKYKKRKTIALRKLENERLNMSRVKDILSELGRQVGPLRRQSEAADKYVRFRDELKKYDINLFLYENGETKTKIRELVEKERIASEDLERSKAEYEVAKEEYEKLSETIHQLDEEISSIRTKISQGDIVKESMLGQIKVYEEQINSANEAESRYRERHEEITEAIQKAEEDKAALTKDKADNQEALTKALSAANDQDSKVLMVQNESEEIRQEIEKKKERLIELVNAKGTINARRERLETMMEQMIKRREELTQDLEKSESDRTAQEEKVKSLEKEFQEAKEQESSLTEDVQARENDLREADQDIARLNRELGDAKTQYTANEARLDSLRNITERYEGYGSSIREVMKLKEKKTGIHGVVADIIKVDKKYEIAIETALGGNIQNIVTDTEATAKDAIAYLKANKFGRATFLPLKAVTGREEFRNEAVLSEHGVLGLASSLVNVEERYEGVARYLLGRIVVADNIDNALALARKYNYSLIIVTLEGELLNRGGSLTGGAFKNKSNLLSRRREIEELENSLKELTQKQEAYAKDIDMVTLRKENLDKEIADLRALLQESRIYLNTIKINLDAANARKEEIQGTFENINKENAQIEEQTGSIQNENTSLDSELDSNQKENESIKEEILALEEKQVKLREQEAAELLIAQNMRVDHSRLVEQNSFLTNSIIRLENEIEKLNNDKTTLETNRTASIRGMDEKREEIEKIRQTLEQAEVDKKELLAHLDEVEAAKEEQTGSHKGFIDKREEYSERIADLDKEVFRLNSSREKLEERFENRSSYIWDEYELTYNNALPLRDESLTDVKEMRDKINELKASIRGLGVINVGAIDEYKEVKERYDFLTNQYQDLQKAEADLVKIIRDLDKQMRTQFNTEFKKIRAEFSKVFKEMFGGGTGSIELEEDVDVLDAGISIIAQPPGKKLQNMLQLSGGEKALTAIAVLFAIQNLKPSPFCILDEIEAALDDANITRFAEYLHKLSNEVQFIVITHRRGTMEAADRLYGITMQEKGVSTLISVDLSDIKDEDIAS
ncbi:MAG: chromosome segregation protein SMC [Lachnospiraceae bacterium]|nr:chromosome segregation protein SMC [Lachnospiraceae bacterium]MBR3360744.1 chromosome segregation protein SMC [Lachnospiraceae bacterium]MBR6357978.1 chromosome segregation protein SMC [Lachnospiraceae bacterium]